MASRNNNIRRRRHKPPSRIRYDQSHPTVSFRVNREDYDKLQEFLKNSGMSIGNLFRTALKVQKANMTKSYNRGWKDGSEDGYGEGYHEAKRRYRITYPCSSCGATIEVDSENAKGAVSKYLVEHRWGHAQCHQQQKRT